jgi:hypothetical protein
MAGCHQLRSGFGCRSADGAAAVSFDGAGVVDGDCDIDELLLSLGAVVLGRDVFGASADGLVAGVEVMLESADGAVVSLVACA